MRDIKFRGFARNTKGGEWVYGYLYKVKSFFGSEYQYLIRGEHLNDFPVEEKTIGQYTGLEDKNGKEIYEGDIVKVNEDIRRVFDLKKIMYVEFSEGAFYLKAEKGIKWNLLRCFPCIVSIEGKMRVEVIGNVWEDSDLLNDN